MRIIGSPVVEALIREDGQPVEPNFPKHIVRRAEWDEWLDEDEEDIRLIDWGESFRLGEEPDRVAQPIDCKAPETIFTDRLDYRIDLWSAGIVVRISIQTIPLYTCSQAVRYHMIFGHRPFGGYSEDVCLVSEMIHFVEALPGEWREKWVEMRESHLKTHVDDTGGYSFRSKVSISRFCILES